MKALTISIIAMLYAAITFGQVRSDLQMSSTSPVASVVKSHYKAAPAMTYQGGYSQGPCTRYHKMKIAGIILASVGGGLFITGAVVTAASAPNYYYDRNGYYEPGYDPMRAGGSAMMMLGAISMGVGIPIAIIGGIKSRRYCIGRNNEDYERRYRSSYLELNSGASGLGVAMKF